MKKFKLTLLLVVLCCGIAVAQKSAESALQRSSRTAQTLLERLQAMYVDSVDIEKQLHKGIDYMLQSLDPYTEYYNEKEAEQFRDNASGEYGGIGIRIATYNGQAYFTDPMVNHPAFNAGLRSGDKVIKVDSVSTRGKDSEFVTKLVRGQTGTPVTVTVVRPYVRDSVITVTMERARLAMPAVPFSTILPSGIGYIRLTTFSPSNTAAHVREVLQEFKKNKNLKGIILDLSDNGGGLLSQAIEIASMFLPRGSKVLETKARVDGESTVYTTRQDPIFPNIPLAVIINRSSASASEVLAGALQDYDRAVLVGERSFGKGLVQSTMPMPYNGMLKVTTAKYYIPSGRLIQALDYSRRDAQGHPGYTPDSLANIFHTAAGRVVKDGGGLQPEIAVPDTFANYYLCYNLVRNPYLFDFANRRSATHPLKNGSQFMMTDEIWEDFTSSLPEKALDYDTETSQALNNLRNAAKEDNLLDKDAEAQLDALEKALKPDHKTELQKSRKEIERLLVPMLAERYGYELEYYRHQLDYEPRVLKAEEILLNPNRYASLLLLKDPKGKKSKKK